MLSAAIQSLISFSETCRRKPIDSFLYSLEIRNGCVRFSLYVRPYWITEDGTKVEGLGKYVYVEDGLKNYISVPLNLNNVTEGIAAGVLKVSYDKSRLKFVESIDGRVFDDMKISAHEDSKIACVGNVSTIQNVKKNDMYITLRFEVTDGIALEDRTSLYQFAISAEDFANENENDVNLKVWDVQY